MNHLLSASAGSGKTHALTTQYLRLLRAQHREIEAGSTTALHPESLLAATFTRKAAGEIFDRILIRLADAALSGNGLLELREAFGEEALTQDECRDLLHHFCRSLHRVQIGTLDSFFGRLCRVYRQEAGLSGDLRMTELKSPHCSALQKEALLSLLKSGDLEETDRLFQTLTKQKAASSVFSKLLPLLQAIFEAVDGAEPHHWEQLSVPDRPAQAEIERAVAWLQNTPPRAENGHWRNAVSNNLRQFLSGDWEAFCSSGLAGACLAGKSKFQQQDITDQTNQVYEVLLAVAKHELLGELKERTLALREISTAFSEKFTEQRRKHGFMLFSETPALLRRVIGDAAQTGRRLDGPLEHLLLDEFQDTSDAQWGLLKGFAQQAASGPGSVFVVGDAKQAIYGWRGGRAEIFEQFGTDIQPLTAGTLEKSYRSSAVVLGVVNAVFGAISTNEVLKEHTQTAERWAAYFHAHQTARPQPGFVELCVSPVPADPIAASADGNGEAGNADDEDGGAGWGASSASPHLAQCGKRIAQEIGRLPPEKSVGVLVRTNKTLAQMVELLRAEGIAVSGEGVGKIADDPAVELILSALLLADHPGHTAAAYHLACSPLGPLLKLPQITPNNSSSAVAGETASAAAAIRRRILSEGYAGLIVEWAAALAPYGLDRTARRLEQLLELAAGFDALPPLRPSEFVRAVRESSVENPGAARVRVMTINRAKGLEFDAVFLPDLEWKTRASDAACLVKRASVRAISGGTSRIEAVYARPSKAVQQLDPNLSDLAEAEAAEEVTGMLCLLYVAMTRPRSALHLYVAPHKLNKNGSPEKPGLKPAAILRAAFCGSASHPAQSGEWEPLGQWGESTWWLDAPVRDKPVPKPAPRPELRFRPSDGTRRGFLPPERDAIKQDRPKTAEDLLRLRGKIPPSPQ